MLVGASGCGKTSLLKKYFEEPDSQNYIPTDSLQHRSKFLVMGHKNINLEIIDSPGASKYETLKHSSYKGCQAIVFVFDITDKKGLEFISK